MKAEYLDTWFQDGVEITGSSKVVDLPFRRTCARALIIRKKDLHILGTLHREGGMYALPGGAIEDGESAAQALVRELEEEMIHLIAPDPEWEELIAVDYFAGYQELSVWFIIPVEDAQIGRSEENIESKWIPQGEEIWYPYLLERIIITLSRIRPELAQRSIVIA
jgi:8-oxo-dGTP pyrophosphatase MutT (NUDIX family)